jgi:tetratricopeptide (TPR) repeat protein
VPILRLQQSPVRDKDGETYSVRVTFEGRSAESRFPFVVPDQQREDIRWYLEDFLQYPLDPAPKIAARIEKQIADLGRRLFEAVFPAGPSGSDARDLWAAVRDRLNDTRVEIVTDVAGATALPWELIRDPVTDIPLALQASAFVRGVPNPAQRPPVTRANGDRIRILLVICRPGGGDDVPFRSVANRIVKGLNEAGRKAFQLDVLRPPTFERLAQVLREAKVSGQPYHVVHFDGHGTFGEAGPGGETHFLSAPRPGVHGYLLFESPAVEDNRQLVDGPALGKLLRETDAPVLVLNACRSAHANPSEAPRTSGGMSGDVHADARALGSLAQEVMDAGAAGVVAMRYNVFVETAANFMAEMYAWLVKGEALGNAVTTGRKQLHDQPLRGIAYEPRPLQDWQVPIVFEAAPVALFPKTKGKVAIMLGEGTEERTLDAALPKRPDAGFLGRDETLLALDRAFDTQHVVLLHAYAGSGKTSTAAEFARWYSLTGGVEGPVLFTSFEQYQTLPRVLDRIGHIFGQALEQAGLHWLALDDAKRRQVALHVLEQAPVLWIWDNVEPVAGFPAGTPSAWTTAEQEELASFLRDARDTQAKFLLTSRRDERAWLDDLPRRIKIPPMPFLERIYLARALVEKHGRRITDVDDWRPLLDFSLGNPMTITVLVGQALRDGITSKGQVEKYVAQLRVGEAVFDDDAEEGRERSLAASLNYGFEQAFSEEDRKRLALLHFFQGFVDVGVLCLMGGPQPEWQLPELRGLTREEGMALLDRAAETGLLAAHGGGFYAIHPALPWFLKKLFGQHYAATRDQAVRAFVGGMGEMGNYYHDTYADGDRGVIAALTAEEANLLHAKNLAQTHRWRRAVISAMQALRTLYDHTGRRAEWARLVSEIVPDYVDSITDGPIPGLEEAWSIVTAYRVNIAIQARRWVEAVRLQGLCVELNRRLAAPGLASEAGTLDEFQGNQVRHLAASLGLLGNARRDAGHAECVEAYREALLLFQRVRSPIGEAVQAYNLGRAYSDLAPVRDLAEAERWYRLSLELHPEGDRIGRYRCFGELGRVAYQRFGEARSQGGHAAEALHHLNTAAANYRRALELVPEDDPGGLSIMHNALASICAEAGNTEGALMHFRESIQFAESQGDPYKAAGIRLNVAVTLARAGRLPDAREYARAAMQGLNACSAPDEVARAARLLADIERCLKATGSAPPATPRQP